MTLQVFGETAGLPHRIAHGQVQHIGMAAPFPHHLIQTDKYGKDDKYQHRRSRCRHQIAGTDDQTDGSYAPDAGRCRQPLDTVPFLIGQNRTGAQEPYAGNDLGGNPFRIRTGIAIDRIEIEGDIDRNNHAQAGAETDEDMRTQTGRLAPGLPFVPDQASQDNSHDEPYDAVTGTNHHGHHSYSSKNRNLHFFFILVIV